MADSNDIEHLSRMKAGAMSATVMHSKHVGTMAFASGPKRHRQCENTVAPGIDLCSPHRSRASQVRSLHQLRLDNTMPWQTTESSGLTRARQSCGSTLRCEATQAYHLQAMRSAKATTNRQRKLTIVVESIGRQSSDCLKMSTMLLGWR